MVRRLTFKELCERNPLFKNIFTRVDTNWVKEDGPEMAYGSVFKTMAHGGAPFGRFADRADRGTHLSVEKPGIYYGKFGALVLRKNGLYKYKLYSEAQKPNAYAYVQGLSEGETLREVFRYRVTNGYLKKLSALKITIFGTDDDVTIDGLEIEGADHFLCEENLPNGSNPDDKVLVSFNNFDVSARDGFKFLKIGGVTVIDGSGPVAGVIGTPIPTQYGEIVITAVTKTAFDTYNIEYKYTLSDSTPDHMYQGKDNVFESIAVELEDDDGSHASDSIDVVVKDDLPTANLALKQGAMLLIDETDGVTADMNETDAPGGDLGMSTLTAGQLFDDTSTFGADGPAAMGAKKFELVLALGDGSDSGLDDHQSMTNILLYAVDDHTIEGRVGGAMGQVAFRLEIDLSTGTTKLTQFRAVYHDDPMDPDESTSPAVLADDLIQVKLTVTDGDTVGDTDVAYVNLNGVIKFEDDGLTAVDDDDFANVAECDTKAGVVIGTLNDLLANDSFGSDEQGTPPIVVNTTGDMGGSVSIDAMGNITYTNNTAAANLGIGDSLVETFTYTIYDGDNDSSQASFVVTTSGSDIVIDTAPTDVSVDEDDLPVIGNNDSGNGDLAMPVPTGSVAYTLSAGATTATVVLAATPTFTKLDGTAITAVWDAMTNTLTGYGTDPMDIVFTIVVTNLTATGFDYELSLAQAVKHLGTDPGFEDDLTFDVSVSITDDCNEDATTSFQALIDDDIPVATADPDFRTLNECDVKNGVDLGDLNELLLNDSYGADQCDLLAVADTGDMGGTITFSNGVFTYVNNTAAADLGIGESLVETFSYIIEDRDGDRSTSTFSVTTTGSDIVIDTAPTDVSVDEDDLPMIGNNDSASGDLVTPVPTGSIAYTLSTGATTPTVVLSATPTFTKLDGTAITAVWDAMTNTLTGYGTDPMDIVFTIVVTNLTATGFDYELSLEQAVKHLGTDPGFEDDLTFAVNVSITDDCGEDATTSFQALIDDDIPVATGEDDFASVAECDTKAGVVIGTVAGLLANDSFGADGPGSPNIVVSTTGDFGGTVSIDAMGNITYTNATGAADLDVGQSLYETFTYKIYDSEGDAAEASFSVTTTGSDVVIDTAPTDVSVDEDDLPTIGNNDSANGDLATPVPTGSIAYTLSASATTATVTLAAAPTFTKLDGTAITAVWDAMTNTLTGYGTSPMDVVFTIVVTNLTATGFDYELSLEQAVKHLGTAPGFEDDLTFDVNVTITDDCNEEATTSFQALIDDDIPVATADPNFRTFNECDVKNGVDLGNLNELVLNDSYGADQRGALGVAPTGDKGGSITVSNGVFIYTNNTAAADLGIGETLVETFIYAIDDKDGDRASSTFTIVTNGTDIVIDTAPTDVSVDEDDLPMIGNNDSASGDLVTPVPTGSIAYTLSAGATTATVVLAATPTFTKLDGTAITAVWDAMTNTLTGYGTDPMDIVFTIVVTNLTATGFDYELSLEQAVKHLGTDPGFEDDLTFDVSVSITDDCNEDATTSFQALIDDDIPVAVAPDSSMLTNTTNSMVMAALDTDGNIDDNVGADQPGTLTFANVVSGTTQATGEIDGQTVNLTSDGDPIILYLSNNDTVLEGWVGDPMMGGTKIFSVTLNLDGDLNMSNDKYTVELFQTIDNGAGVTFTNLTGTGPAGNDVFKIIDSGQGLEILVTPGDITSDTDTVGGTINSDNDDIGISDQFIDSTPPPETLRIDFGQFSITGADQFNIDSHQGVNGVRFQVVDTGGPPTNQVDMFLTVYDANANNTLNDDSGLRDTITKIEVYASDGTTLIDSATGDGAGSNTMNGITFDFDGVNGVTVNNLVAGQFVTVFTGDDFNRLEITNVTNEMAANDQFSVGGLSTQETDTGESIGLSFDVALQDAEGDAATLIGQIDVTVNPELIA